MGTLFVTYPGDAGTRFDREYYLGSHLPLVMEAWGPHGLESAAVFFPAGDGAGTIAVCLCVFPDDAAMDAALASPRTEDVMADVGHFTDARPSRSRAAPVRTDAANGAPRDGQSGRLSRPR